MINELSYAVIGAAMRVHSEFGPGMREEVCHAALVAELRRDGRNVREQVSVPVAVGGRTIDKAFRVDLIVDDQLVVEIKCVKAIGLHDIKQVAGYLRVMGLRLGLILNFQVPSMRDGIKRVVNGFSE